MNFYAILQSSFGIPEEEEYGDLFGRTVIVSTVNEKGEEVVVEEEVITESGRRSHAGMTRGEIMEYEMTRVSEEMNALQEEVKQSQEKKTQLKTYQEKLENLKRLNDAGIR